MSVLSQHRHARTSRGLLAALAIALPLSIFGPTAAEAQIPVPPDNNGPDFVVASTPIFELKPTWALPVEGYELTATFGESSSMWSSTHTGLDFAADEGTPIHAVSGGVVESVEYDGSYGNKTVVRLDDGTEVWYCHQSDTSVEPGQRVEAGEEIGFVGSTGNVTGPHLHLEVQVDGEPQDPFTVLTDHGLNP